MKISRLMSLSYPLTAFLLGMFVFLYACGNDENNDDQKLISFLSKNKHYRSDAKVFVFIPLSGGCGGCTQSAIAFLKENYQNPKIQFIVSNTTLKGVKLSLNGPILNSNLVLSDVGEEAINQGIVNVFPLIVYVTNNHINRRIRVDASNLRQEFDIVSNLIY